MPSPRYGGYALDDIAHAVAMVESSGGTQATARYEPGFERRYLRGKPQWETLAKQYGWKRVSSSYGKYQIMYPVAVELGFKGTPEELADDATNRAYFEKKFLQDYRKTSGNLQRTLQRYNGGGDPDYAAHVIHHLQHPEQEDTMRGQGGTSQPSMDPVDQHIFRINRAVEASGFAPLNAHEVHGMLRRMVPAPAINNRNDTVVGEVDSAVDPRMIRHPVFRPQSHPANKMNLLLNPDDVIGGIAQDQPLGQT